MRCLQALHTKLASWVILARRWPVSWALPIWSALLPRLRSINCDPAMARFALRTGNRSIPARRIFHASMRAHRAAAQSRERRGWTLDRPSRGLCARDRAPRPLRAKPSQRAGLYRRLHDHRFRRGWRFVADAASAHTAGDWLAGQHNRSLITLTGPQSHLMVRKAFT